MKGKFVVAWLLIMAFAGCLSLCKQAYAQQQNISRTKPVSAKVASGKKVSSKGATLKPTSGAPVPGKQKDEFHRPAPVHPTSPQIPAVNRQNPDKVFLEKADSLYKPLTGPEESDRQIVTGNVVFRQEGMWMYCDSAYYYADENSMDAFGHVRMEQGDTLRVYADKIFYDGELRYARLRNGLTEPKVRLMNRDVSLTTDSLDYDLVSKEGWYECGGLLKDKLNTLVSQIGRYNTGTKDAEFYHDVELHGEENDFDMYTDTLYYNTATNIARIVSPTRIYSPEDTIFTSLGLYNTKTRVADLQSRSLVIHTDSLHRVTTLEGDSLVYDPDTKITRAFSFRDPMKRPTPMVITDTARKATLIGGFGLYNDSTKEAFATEYPLMMDYSRPDTLYLRADSIRSWLVDSLHVAKAAPRARFFRKDMQGVADTIFYTEVDSILRLIRKPIVWSEERQLRGDTIIIHLQDSTADYAVVPKSAMMMELIEGDFFNQLHSDWMKVFFEQGNIRHLDAEGSVQTIFLPMDNDSTYSKMIDAESSSMTIDFEGNGIEKLKMWPEVSGNVTPLFMVTSGKKLLPKAEWLVILRPRREWYEETGEVYWADDLGELSEELEKYFEN